MPHREVTEVVLSSDICHLTEVVLSSDICHLTEVVSYCFPQTPGLGSANLTHVFAHHRHSYATDSREGRDGCLTTIK